MTGAVAEEALDLLGVEPADRQDCRQLLEGDPGPGVEQVLESLAKHLGGPDGYPDRTGQDERTWIEAYLRFTPELLEWYQRNGIPDAVVRDTLADFGRQLSINRRVHQRFGMDTWSWLSHLFAGRIFQLGRLQYLIHVPDEQIPGVGPGEEVLGIHIPESGSLDPGAVRASLEQAVVFFRSCFPERPVRTANCSSWLLDPYLRGHLPADSNIRRFIDLFTPYCEPVPAPGDAVYFTFRVRGMDGLADLPRTTTLQHTVLERIDDGGSWQLGSGYLRLP